MKYIQNRLNQYLLWLALLLCAHGAYAGVALTCRDYDALKKNTVLGKVTAEQLSECEWQLTASPEKNFSSWSFDNTLVSIIVGDTASPVITIRLIAPTMADTIPCEAHFVYTIKYCKSCRDYDIATDASMAFPHEDDTVAVAGKNDTTTYGTIAAIHVEGSCWQLEAQAKEGYTFAQWSDGTYVNPRMVDIVDEDSITYYATFIPTNTIGKVDEWMLAPNALRVTTKESEGSLIDYFATVFYDGDRVLSTEPGQFSPGVYDLDAPEYDAYELAGKRCHIVFKEVRTEGCYPIATLDTIIPFIADGEVEVPLRSDLEGAREKFGVHVFTDGTAVFASPMDIAELDVYPGGKAIIDEEVSATSVTLRAHGPNQAYPELLVTDFGTLTNTNSNTIYFDYALNLKRYYPFSLPYTVNTEDATYRSGDDAWDHFAMDAYDGAARAAGSTGWYYYFDYAGGSGHKDIVAGKGYDVFAEPMIWNSEEQTKYLGNIRFPMTVDLSSGPEAPKSAVSVELNSALDPAQSNWNLIGSPYLSSYRGTVQMYDGSTFLDPVEWVYYSEDGFKTYDHASSSSMVFQPFHSYFIQVDPATTHIAFATPDEGRIYAPSRYGRKAASSQTAIKAGITLTQNDKSDHTGFFIGEKYTYDYDINGDLTKMFGSKQNLAVFMLSGNQKLANIALPTAYGSGEQETVIPLGYNKATKGAAMTFAFDEERYASVLEDERVESLYLIDNAAGVTTDLLHGSYTCTAYETADNDRFMLGIRYIKSGSEVATDLGESQATVTKMTDGIYDIMGRRIDADNVRTLGAGVYVVIENGQARKEVIR